MSDKVQYSIINSEEGAISVQSTIKSFNLDHVTSKDIKSFYSNFSQYSAWDTGLLPVDGSGMLCIRTAGEYTQFAYQHAPGMYHINWAANEGNKYASAYYLAQPYRIIICDMKDGNLLGARTFYSPYPITNPSQQLYHVNLPNINCRGYRGNGVGWICLYQQEDWSALPLNERIVRFIERCSGVETYNDGNMSETDGTRFYQLNNKPEYTWNPIAWQAKSEQEGFAWTLDPDLWIPVLVKSMDSQGEHDYNGQPLTFADAIVGDYKAYYYDEKLTKPINAIIRPDKELSSNEILSYFVRSYNGATANPSPLLDDTFNKSATLKEKNSSAVFTGSTLMNTVASHSETSNDDDDEDSFFCYVCQSTQSSYGGTDPDSDEVVCESCFEDNYVYIENANSHYSIENERIVYSDHDSKYYHTEYDTVVICDSCDYIHATSSLFPEIIELYKSKVITLDNGDNVCPNCITDYATDNGLTLEKCYSCHQIDVITDLKFINNFPTATFMYPYLDSEDNIVYESKTKTFCMDCYSKNLICPCGLIKPKDSNDFNPCTQTTLLSEKGSTIIVNKACSTCVTPVQIDENGNSQSYYQPINEEVQKLYINSSPLVYPNFNQGWEYKDYQEEAF